MPKLALTTIPQELFAYNENLQTFNVNNNLSSVTKISDAPFFRCKNLTFENYDFSNVTSIGSQAFRECIKLKTINLSTNCISISERAFYGDTSLTNIGDTSNVTSINDLTFYGCSSLEQITLGDITYLAYSVFDGCTSLTTLNIDWTKINRIDENAIKNTKLGLNETLELNLTNNTSYPYGALSYTLYKKLILHMNNLGSYKGNIGDFDSRYPLYEGMSNLEYLDYSDTNIYSWAPLYLGKDGPMETLILPSTIRYGDWRCTYKMPNLQYLIILVEDPSLLNMNNPGSSVFNGNENGSSGIVNIYVKDSNVRDLYLAHEFWGAIPNAENRIKPLSELPTGVWTTGLYQQYEPYLSNH